MSLTLKKCYSYLIEEEKPKNCFKLFIKYISNGYDGLCITRTNPKKLREKYELKAEILWLSDRKSKTEKTISSVLESMIYSIFEFIEKEENCIVMIDGLEYLITNNEFNPVLNFVRQLVDEISERNAILLIPVSPLTFKKQELKMLERELEKIIIEVKEKKEEENIEKKEQKKVEKIKTKKIKVTTKEKSKVNQKISEEKSFPKIKCRYCNTAIEIKTTKRPLTIKCQSCGRKYTLTKKSSKIPQKSKIQTIKCIYCNRSIQIKNDKKTTKCPYCNKFLIV